MIGYSDGTQYEDQLDQVLGNQAGTDTLAGGGGKDFIENTFLKGLDLAEKAGLGGTAVKLYNDIIQRGRTDPITEKDLPESEQKQFRDLVMHHATKNSVTEGKIDYKDYFEHLGTKSFKEQFKEGALDTNILGGFQYKINEDNSIEIKDKWDFNYKDKKEALGESHRENMFLKALVGVVDPRSLAVKIGRDKISEESGLGIPVHIKLPGQ